MAHRPQKDIRTFPGFGILAALAIVFLYAPITFLIFYSFNSGDSVSVWSGFSIRWYQKVVANTDIQVAAINSLLIATVAATVATVLAMGAALATTRSRRIKNTGSVLAILTLPLMVPEIVSAVSTLVLFVTIGLKLGMITVLLAHTVFCIPFAYLPLKARLEAMDESLEDAASDLYATSVQAFRFVTLPLLLPGVMSGFLLAFIISLDDFIITSMVAGPSATTLPIYIYSMLRLGITPQVNAISTILIGVSTIIVLTSAILGRTRKTQ
ncbi:ABC transporter permease [Agrobacterium rhizogenes]|uniref:ABC transporter permease n=1 Tax=Rhizobium rhizogenes TaxID=359 RepID=UPI0015731B5E|nr:ABC transporter permease [Rhizobium rhizogenes]NTG51706.1 ABC transporter permease [Rhizobium rhizogenes]